MSHILHVAVSAKKPRCAWSWRVVQPGNSFVDGTGTDPWASAYRLRLHALVEGLRSLDEGTEVRVITTDSTTIQLAEQWLPAWEARGFNKKRIESRDLVIALASELRRLSVSFTHQPSRKGDPHAKDCSLHAKRAAKRMNPPATPPSRGSVTVRNDVEVVAWTDGGSRTNPGPSGWGVLLVHLGSGATLVLRGGEKIATNNRMELTAIARALGALRRPTRIEIRTDSKFCISACEQWRHGWKRRGWKKADGEEPANLDRIQELDALLDRHRVVFTWVPGHTGEPGNEYADTLCNEAIDAVLAEADPTLVRRTEAPPFPIQQETP